MSTTHTSKTPKEARDLWSTPQWLYDWLDARFGFDVDLACSIDNCKAETGFYSERFDALTQDWIKAGKRGFCNPPYSKIAPWLEKGYRESKRGFTSVFLVPTPNGESYYSDHVFGKASEIIFIKGRIGFVASCDFVKEQRKDNKKIVIRKGQEVGGNTRGSCVIIYRPSLSDQTHLSTADRNEIKARFSK